MIEHDNFSFTDCTQDFIAEQPYATALKDHASISTIIDILSRKENHHLLLPAATSEKINVALLQSIALQLTENHAPKALRDTHFIYFDINRFTGNDIHSAFSQFREMIKETKKRIIFATNHAGLIQTVLHDDQWRIILLSEKENLPNFSLLPALDITEAQLISLLKNLKTELEHFHDVIILDETITAAISITKHYLSHTSLIDKTLELLDSAAARASTTEHYDHSHSFTPTVTHLTLAQVVSNWTQIPLPHLHNNTFQTAKFAESLQRRIFGQDDAIAAIATVLQHACIKLQDKPGPLCNFLLVGASETGKATTTSAIAEQLFGQKQALIHVNLSETYQSIEEVKVFGDTPQSNTLLAAIQKTPYAIVLLDNIQQISPATFSLFKSILMQGMAFDILGNKYDFRHAIIVMTTTLGADKISNLTQSPPVYEANKTLDLMQLVLNEHPHHSKTHLQPHLSAQELCEELAPALEGYFPSALLQHVNIIPFLPLDYASLEKIMRMKIKNLGKHLDAHFNIELNYAPEVIKFLAHEALWRKPNAKSFEKLLEQHLYSAVANEILAYAEEKNRPQRLLLQLNEDGQLLRCEFIGTIGTHLYHHAT